MTGIFNTEQVRSLTEKTKSSFRDETVIPYREPQADKHINMPKATHAQHFCYDGRAPKRG